MRTRAVGGCAASRGMFVSHELLFYNGTDTRVSVAVAYGGGDDGSCPDTDENDVITRGWWNIDPQQTATAFEIGNAVVDRGAVWYFAYGGGREWSGDDWGPILLPATRFYNCNEPSALSTDDGPEPAGFFEHNHGFRQVHFGGADRHTVRLNP
jgi:hypothetical protein